MEEKKTLNSEGVNYRREHVETGSDNRYKEGEGQEYGENSQDVLSRDGEPLGKGTGKAMGYAIKNNSAPKTQINYDTLDTKNGGGDYDINGRQGVGGRKRLMGMNEYNRDNQYSDDLVTVDPKTYKDLRIAKRK